MFSTILKNEKIQIVLIVLTACVLSAVIKYEIIWDFINYHYYNGYAFLNNRLEKDIAPASVLTYFNPVLDTITYLLTKGLNDNVTLYHFIMGLPYGMALSLMFFILKNVFSAQDRIEKIKIFLAFLISATGFATFSQIGTSSHEMTLTVFVLGSFLLLEKTIFDEQTTNGKNFFIAGFLLGAGAGLKITTALYCVTTGMTVMIFYSYLKNPKKQILFFILGGLTGFLVTNGFWMYVMYKHFENPFFPLLNGVFQSPYFVNDNFKDAVYLEDRTIFQTFLLPFLLLFHFKENFVAGTDFSDARFAIAYVVFFSYIFFVLLKKLTRKKIETSSKKMFVYVFLALTYFIWLFASSVIRYMMPFEMLLSIVIVDAFFSLPHKTVFAKALRTSFVIVFSFILISSPFLTLPWGTRFDSDFLADFEEISVPDGTMVLLHGNPMSAIAVPIAEKSNVRIFGFVSSEGKYNRYWSFANSSKLGEIRTKALAEHKGPTIAFVKESVSYLLNPLPEVKKMQCRFLKRRLLSTSDKVFPQTIFCWSEDLNDLFGQGEPIEHFVWNL